MKKLVVITAIAGILGATTPAEISKDPSFITDSLKNDLSTKVSSILDEKQTLPDFIKKEIEKAHNMDKNKSLDAEPNSLLFPIQVQTIGIDRMASGYLGNMNNGGFIEGINPPLVDVEWENLVYCAGTIKGFIGFSKNIFDRTNEENVYVNKEGIDAWMLPNELKKIGYNQEINLMNYFDTNKIGNNDIVGDKDGYNNALLETGNYLKNSGVEGSVLFMYFNLSHYKGVVREYNAVQKRKNPEYLPHINTHEGIFLGNNFMEFKADEVKLIDGKNISEINGEIDVFDYITNFVQQRGGYNSALNQNTKDIINKNLLFFNSLIEIYINGEQINLSEELIKSTELRKKINKDDIIKIGGPILLDGFHNVNSESKYISQNNHARTIFYFEYILIGTYTPSELMTPNNSFFERQNKENISMQGLTDKFKISNLYFLKRYEDINFKLKETILRFKFGKQKLLIESKEEINLINSVEGIKNSKQGRKILYKIISLQKEKIDSIISSLTPNEKREFYKEYENQIRGLQMMGYMQHEGEINKYTTNINAPIPYFDTSNLEDIFKKYVDNRKKELSEKYSSDEKGKLEDKTVRIYFYPTDNFANIFNQLENKLQKYVERYNNFGKIKDLDLLKKRKFVDIVIDKFANDKNIDVSMGKIPSMRNIVIPLDFIDSILNSILSETYVDALKLSDIDTLIISEIKKTEQEYNLLSYIITQENYEVGFPFRKFLKKIGRLLDKTSSFGDFQLKIYNLLNKEKSLIDWPNVVQINKAITYIESPEFIRIIGRRLMRFEEVIEPDYVIIEQLKTELEYVNEDNRVEKGKKVYELFKELFRFNDTREINIIGKIIQVSLTLDRFDGYYSHINAWLERSGISIDEIIHSKDLQKRYMKLFLTIHNRGEKTVLIGNSENYILRVMEALGDNIKDENYPKLKKDYKGHIDYNENVMEQHLSFYKNRLPFVRNNNELTIEVKNELEKEITNIVEGDFNAEYIYKLFNNKTIKSFLKNNGYDTCLIPTIEEFENTAFRELFFDYAKTPTGRTAPKVYNIEKILANTLGAFILSVGGLIGIFKLRKKKIIDKVQEENIGEDIKIKEEIEPQILDDNKSQPKTYSKPNLIELIKKS